jgi:hypothetical protein
MAVPPVLSDLVSAPNAPNRSGRGGRDRRSNFYELPDNLGPSVLTLIRRAPSAEACATRSVNESPTDALSVAAAGDGHHMDLDALREVTAMDKHPHGLPCVVDRD